MSAKSTKLPLRKSMLSWPEKNRRSKLSPPSWKRSCRATSQDMKNMKKPSLSSRKSLGKLRVVRLSNPTSSPSSRMICCATRSKSWESSWAGVPQGPSKSKSTWSSKSINAVDSRSCKIWEERWSATEPRSASWKSASWTWDGRTSFWDRAWLRSQSRETNWRPSARIWERNGSRSKRNSSSTRKGRCWTCRSFSTRLTDDRMIYK